MKKILILTSGKKSKLTPFKLSKRDLKIDLTTASFDDVCFDSANKELLLKNGTNISDFKVIYFRLVGKALETAALVAEYAKKKRISKAWPSKRIKIVDKIYQKSQIYPITQSKAQEMKSLSDAGLCIPGTFFGSLGEIAKKCPAMFGFPLVIKSTSGRRGREVYSPNGAKELKKLLSVLVKEEKAGKKFFAQEFVNCTKRVRVLIVGGKIIGSISQLTKWHKRVTGYTPQEDEKKIHKFVPDKNMEKLAITAVSAVGIDIAGVDILEDVETKKLYVIEVNAAPSWKLIKKYCRVNVEYEILKFVSR